MGASILIGSERSIRFFSQSLSAGGWIQKQRYFNGTRGRVPLGLFRSIFSYLLNGSRILRHNDFPQAVT